MSKKYVFKGIYKGVHLVGPEVGGTNFVQGVCRVLPQSTLTKFIKFDWQQNQVYCVEVEFLNGTPVVQCMELYEAFDDVIGLKLIDPFAAQKIPWKKLNKKI